MISDDLEKHYWRLVSNSGLGWEEKGFDRAPMDLGGRSRELSGRRRDLIGSRRDLVGMIMIGEVDCPGILDIFVRFFYAPTCKFGCDANGQSDFNASDFPG